MELNQQSTMEEEAIKRNTDCVYFLASPLTCKKGSECEYRHSETARINPRDCWFWMNGNCLNPKCAFRHPPLDGLLGPPGGATSVAPSLPPQSTALTQTSALHAPANSSSKQSVACFYFQKGLCLKGDKCPFMHGFQPVNNPAQQQTVRVGPVTDPLQTLKKPPNEPPKLTFQKKSPPKNIVKPVEEIAPPAKPIFKPEISPDNRIAVKKNTLPAPIDDEFVARSNPNNALVFTGIPAMNRPRTTRQAQPLEDRFPDGEESDEFLGESSPGFDVLVDDELEDPNYFLSEDIEYRRSADHGRWDSSNLIDELDFGHRSPVLVDSLAKFDRDPHLDLMNYEFYGRVNDRFGWEQRRASSERILERPLMPERGGLLREESPNRIGGLDLRHRLSKRRRVNGSRFVDHNGEFFQRDKDRLLKEDKYRGRSRRDPLHVSAERSISRRLQGRITLSSRSSVDGTPFNSNSDREVERGRSWGRLSPGKPVPYLGRLHERIKRRTPEEISTATEGRNFRCQQSSRRDEVNFAGPKSLAELKNAKASGTLRSEVVHDEHRGSRAGKVMGHQESENSLLFEGPKPLSVILKRKRETGFGNGADSSNKEVTQTEREDPATEVPESQPTTNAQSPVDSGKEANHSPSSHEEPKGVENLVRLAGEGIESMDSVCGSQTPIVGDPARLEEDLIMEEGMEDQEIKGSDRRDGESEEGNWKMEEENGDPEDEFLDDEDGDDFARRLGVMFS